MTKPKPLTHWQALKLDSRIDQFFAALTTAMGLLGVLGTILHMTGLRSGDWLFSLCVALFAWAWIEWNYWQRRAKEAEKPLPSNQAIITYSTPEAAATARWIEEQWSESIKGATR
ncbi:hypothetical protein [Nocardia aurea]|uniref:hypothetical protein n=1 Tax=Nocardia aurea TaxID=2144174 RepID=UPI0033BE2DB9